MRPSTCASLGTLVIAALLVPVLAAASWDPLFRTHLTFPEGEVWSQGRLGMASGATTGDFNGDGLPDIAVTNAYSPTVTGITGTTISVLLHAGSPGYPPMYQPWKTIVVTDTGTTPLTIASADLNGDGKRDILTGNYIINGGAAQSISVLYGMGAGLFKPVVKKAPPNFQGGFAVGDLNNDGRADVACLVGTGGGSIGVAVMLSTPDSLGAPAIYASGPGRTSVAIADVTTDGVPDIAVAYANSLLVLVGDNTGAFGTIVDPIPAASTASGMSIVNLNGDVYADIVQMRSDPFTAVILMGTGFGGFQPPVEIPLGPPLTTARNLLTGDVDGDGDIDLVGYSNSPADVAVFKNNGAGTFGPATHCAGMPQSGAPAPLTDVNQDGWLDLVAGDNFSDVGNSVAVLLNDGAGGFRMGVKAIDAVYPRHETLGDFNRDGKLDIAVGDQARITLGIGIGDGTFAANGYISTFLDPGTLVLADINRDGILDLVAQLGSDISIYLGVGDNTFTLLQSISGTSLTPRSVVDLNRDGRPDLLTGSGSQFRVYFQLSDGTYSAFTAYAPTVGFRSFTSGDWNRDGAVDVAVAGPSGLSFYPGSTTTPGALGTEVVLASGTWYEDVCAIDANRDGAPDLAGRVWLAGGNVNNGVHLFPGNGSGGFGAAAPYGVMATTGRSIDSWDANRDGIPDLITVGQGAQGMGNAHAEVLLGGAGGTFALRTGYGLGIPTWNRASFGDVNGDAMPDIVSASWTLGSDADVDQSVERTILATPPAKGNTLRQATFYPGINTAFVAVGDVNRDGKPDVVTGTNGANPGIAVLLGNGNGGLGASTTLTQSRYGHKVSLADFNRDGILDIAALDIEVGSERIATMLGVGDGTFGARNDFPIASGLDFDIGDMNRDGKLDIVVSSPTAIRVLLGTGVGTFTAGGLSPLSGITVYDLDLADLNRDGCLDIVLVAGNVKIIYGSPLGFLGSPIDLSAPLTECQNVAVADFNRDGAPDIVANNGATYYVLWGSPVSPPISYTTANLGYGALDMKVGEAEANGKPFLFLTRNADGLEVFSVSPTGVFSQVGSYQVGQGAYQLALADMDRDGQVDVVCPGNVTYVSVNLHGFSTTTGVDVRSPAPAAPRMSLHQNYPNPFNPGTTIRYTLPRAERVQLRVYDVHGRLVRTLRDGSEPAGDRRVEWDGRDRSGQPVASGVYLYRLTTESGESQSNRMVVAK